MNEYIVHNVGEVRKPIIEQYLKIKDYIKNILKECSDVECFEQDYFDVAYDFDFLVTLQNHDNIEHSIYEMIRRINDNPAVQAKVLSDQIEDVLLDEAEEFITIDIYCNLILQQNINQKQ